MFRYSIYIKLLYLIHIIIFLYTIRLYVYITHADFEKIERTNEKSQTSLYIRISYRFWTTDLLIIQCINQWYSFFCDESIHLKVWKGVLRILYIIVNIYIIYTYTAVGYTSYYYFFIIIKLLCEQKPKWHLYIIWEFVVFTGGSSSGFSDAPNLQNEGIVWWDNVYMYIDRNRLHRFMP